MYCNQCGQAAGGTACTGSLGACGKTERTAQLQDRLTGAMIGFARAAETFENTTEKMDRAVIGGLFMTMTNVGFDDFAVQRQINMVREFLMSKKYEYDMNELWSCGDEDIKSAKSLLLYGLRGIAAHVYHSLALKKDDQQVISFIYEALRAIGSDLPLNDLLTMIKRAGEMSFRSLELLDTAAADAYGTPLPADVSTVVEPGPFIIVSGHDLRDLERLLKQSYGYGINIYTHSDMLSAHSYPKLAGYSHLKGHFGTSWQNQAAEFSGIPAPVLFTGSCMMPPAKTYSDRIFTSGPACVKGVMHIFDDKDFSPVIERSIELAGWSEPVNTLYLDCSAEKAHGDHTKDSCLTTGFGRSELLKSDSPLTDGTHSHIFIVSGCDAGGARDGYFQELLSAMPEKSLVLTSGSIKFTLQSAFDEVCSSSSRIVDTGQCSDIFSAAKAVIDTAKKTGTDMDSLHTSLVLSWFEQKTVSILLALLYMGFKDIYLAPDRPSFISDSLLDILKDEYRLHIAGNAAADIADMIK